MLGVQWLSQLGILGYWYCCSARPTPVADQFLQVASTTAGVALQLLARHRMVCIAQAWLPQQLLSLNDGACSWPVQLLCASCLLCCLSTVGLKAV
jgi:hypothetical protein